MTTYNELETLVCLVHADIVAAKEQLKISLTKTTFVPDDLLEREPLVDIILQYFPKWEKRIIKQSAAYAFAVSKRQDAIIEIAAHSNNPTVIEAYRDYLIVLRKNQR